MHVVIFSGPLISSYIIYIYIFATQVIYQNTKKNKLHDIKESPVLEH